MTNSSPHADWWRQAVLYQIYPRSFQDSNDDGIGDLEGIRQRLDYLVNLGVDGLWMSPIYRSPLADGGYDISDHTEIHPDLGTLSDFEALLADAHARHLRVILDLVPNHTSVEHPWFREHPDWYVWSDRDGPANNWLSAFGGPAWSRDEQGRGWYLHSFYKEQPDLNWRVPEVREAVGDIIRTWVDRGVDGFRVDAIDRLAKDPALRDDPPGPGPRLLPLPAEYATLHHVHSRNAPGMGEALSALRTAAGETFLIGEVYRPTSELALYLEHFDAVFAFEFMFCPWRPGRLARVLAPLCELERVAWVLANHDFSRFATRQGEQTTRLAAMLLLTLPGPVFIYQGDELGMIDGPTDARWDRAGRDVARHPMQWEPTDNAGFTNGTPWLPAIDPEHRNARDQSSDPTSLLSLYRNLLRLRRQLRGALELENADETWLTFRRGRHTIRLNFSEEAQPMPQRGAVVIQSHPKDDLLHPSVGWCRRRTDAKPGMTEPISPPAVRTYRPESLPAYVSNGLLGLRVSRVPQLRGLAILNGFAGIDGQTGVESFARAPYPLAGDLEIGAARLSDAPERAVLRHQRYDFGAAELHTRFSFSSEAARADVEVLTFCSRSQPTLALQELTLRVDRACDVTLLSGINPIGVPGRLLARDTTSRGSTGESSVASLRWESHGGIASCGGAYWTALSEGKANRSQEEDPSRPLATRYAFRARSGRTYRLRQISCLVSDSIHSDPDGQAIRLLYAGVERGFDRLREENRRAWDEIWRGRVNLVGAPARWQALVDAAHFYLNTSAHTSSPSSTSMFGLAYWPTYHYYRGHVMWDIDTFVVPPLLLTQPEVARTLLEYRSDRLDAARKNASMSGYCGAQFPWESSPRKGEESAPGDGAASAHEHHVSLDVGLAFIQYLHATQDWEWARERAWPLIRSICEWLASRVIETRRGFEIRDVTGIAERKQTVSNNAYVNLAAIQFLQGAAEVAEALGHAYEERWRRIAARLVVPLDRRTKVIRNHDAYRTNEEKGETPEAAAALFLLGRSCDPEVERATFEYYLRLSDGYVGSPMLSSLLGVFASRIGDRRRSLELFERGYADFVVDPFTMTLEYGPAAFPDQPQAAPFTANIGGLLTSCLYGVTGIRLSAKPPSDWCERKTVLPHGWEAIEVERVWARGRPARLTARHGARAQIQLDD